MLSTPLLQWGRAHVSAETREAVRAKANELLLQWGRAHVSAETLFFSTDVVGVASLQWGRAHVSAETNDLDAELVKQKLASMGPRSRERGNRMSRLVPGRLRPGFNGAALT